jgi:hypothetical protein
MIKTTEVKKKETIEKLGTFDLPASTIQGAPSQTRHGTPLPDEAWKKEYNCIHQLVKKISSRYTRKTDFDRHYGTHKGVTPNDYGKFNITYTLENCSPCPECHGQTQMKDLRRSQLICRTCGLVIRAPPPTITPPGKARMAITVQDINKASTLQQKGEQVTPQDIAWSNYFQGDMTSREKYFFRTYSSLTTQKS